MEESSHGESNWRRTECLIINSTLFSGDSSDHFSKSESKWEETDHESYYRYRFPTVVPLETDGIRNRMPTYQFWQGITPLFWKGFVQEDRTSLLWPPCKEFDQWLWCHIFVLDQPLICGTVSRVKVAPLVGELKRKDITLTDVGTGQPKIEILIDADAAGQLYIRTRTD